MNIASTYAHAQVHPAVLITFCLRAGANDSDGDKLRTAEG